MWAARFRGTASTIGVLIDAGTDIDYLDNVSCAMCMKVECLFIHHCLQAGHTADDHARDWYHQAGRPEECVWIREMLALDWSVGSMSLDCAVACACSS